MEILPKDDEIINKSSEISSLEFPSNKPEVLESIEELIPDSKDADQHEVETTVTNDVLVAEKIATKKPRRLSRKSMIAEIKAYKDEISMRSNFRKGTAVQLSTLYLKICNMNFTISNLKHLSDDEVFAIWNDIKLSK
ncbi:hypothetical protein HOH51_02430 [bacterium]|jgi:hypothetical protein|nr:hypothetical protein [bacterium]